MNSFSPKEPSSKDFALLPGSQCESLAQVFSGRRGTGGSPRCISGVLHFRLLNHLGGILIPPSGFVDAARLSSTMSRLSSS